LKVFWESFVFGEKYDMLGAQTKHSSLFLKLFSDSTSLFLENFDVLGGIILGEF
jgi:hypothetical protein